MASLAEKGEAFIVLESVDCSEFQLQEVALAELVSKDLPGIHIRTVDPWKFRHMQDR